MRKQYLIKISHCEPPPITFIPCEEHFRPVLPTIEGNVDYLTLRGQLTTMDFAARMADSPLLQWFCQVGQLDRVKVPAKSTLQRYATWLPEEEMREVINGLLRKAGAAISDGKQVLDLEAPLDLSRMFLDTTCLKANIHFPVDWVLMRDGVKSLMQSVELIRSHGLKSRMCEPQEFITKINRLSMEMTHTRRKKNGHKERKRVLREMKRIVTVMRSTARGSKEISVGLCVPLLG